MKKIGLDLRMLGSRHGGIGRYVFEIARNVLAIDRGNEYVGFINPRDADPADIDAIKQAGNITLVPANARHYSVMEQTKFLYLLNRCRLDLAHFPNFNVPMLYRRPFVATIHDMVHHKIGGAKKSHLIHFYAYKKVIEFAARQSRSIITVSEHSKKDIASALQVPPEKIRVIYEGTSLDTRVSEADLEAVKKKFWMERPYFLFVGVLERKKNIISLARGFDAFVKKYGTAYDLVLAGKPDPHYPEIKHKALDIVHKDHVLFTGYVDDADLRALYAGAHAFVSASLHEGFGLPGVEAMKFGLPLGVSNVDVFNEIYDNAAVYFNPLDPDDIADKLYLLVRDEDFWRQMQSHSLQRGALFDWGKAAKETVEVYKSL